MENENSPNLETTESTVSQLHKVTPLSKYLAMALFVLLPFIGGWVGYMYAPEKVVEVEKVVVKEKLIETNDSSEVPTIDTENEVDYYQVEIGDEVKGFIFTGTTTGSFDSEVAHFEGIATVTGLIDMKIEAGPGPRLMLSEMSVKKLPAFWTDTQPIPKCIWLRDENIMEEQRQLLITGTVENYIPATTTVTITGLQIYGPTQVGWCHETDNVEFVENP